MSTSSAFTAEQLHHLPDALSAPRFATYLRARGGEREDALKLYQWNLEISSAFLVPLHILEVVVRNAVVEAIETHHGGTWPWSSGFLRSLPDTRRGYSPKGDLLSLSRRHQTSGKIIADLKFVFWEKMLASRHQSRIWDNTFFNVFANAAATGSTEAEARAALREDIGNIRSLRNRIAHHEPIFTRNLHQDLERLKRAVEWRCDTTAGWLASIEPVTPLIAEMPQITAP